MALHRLTGGEMDVLRQLKEEGSMSSYAHYGEEDAEGYREVSWGDRSGWASSEDLVSTLRRLVEYGFAREIPGGAQDDDNSPGDRYIRHFSWELREEGRAVLNAATG